MTDIAIAQKVSLQHINHIAEKLGLDYNQIETYGKYKAKIPLHYIDENRVKKSNLVLVTAISPTPAGEGKTTLSIGLSEALNLIGKKTTVVVREPSLGPVFGMKGGATGGGYSQVLPMEDINLHFTGDFSAVEKAHNLLSAVIDNHLQHNDTGLDIDPRTIVWKRVLDVNDRSLRKIISGLGGTANGTPRETGFDITAASEIMAILCLSENRTDLKNRLGNIFIGYTYHKKPVFARDLKVQGAMAALLKDAIKPNLVQTIKGNPAIVHGGPFANIAQGTNTVLATKLGMTFSEYTITESGFGADLGAEKFLDIKCQSAGLNPKAAVITTTIRALKFHGGIKKDDLKVPNPEAVFRGLPNLEKHIENIKKFNIPPIIGINVFATDSHEEIEVVRLFAQKNNIRFAEADVWGKGGDGALMLAKEVIEAVENNEAQFKPLYNLNESIPVKIERIAKEVYGAKEIVYTAKAEKDLKKINDLNLNHLAVCMAKTQYSFSDNPKMLNRPEDFTITIREIEIAAGAGFVIPITGEIMRMPGLPLHPASEKIDIDDHGNITGLF